MLYIFIYHFCLLRLLPNYHYHTTHWVFFYLHGFHCMNKNSTKSCLDIDFLVYSLLIHLLSPKDSRTNFWLYIFQLFWLLVHLIWLHSWLMNVCWPCLMLKASITPWGSTCASLIMSKPVLKGSTRKVSIDANEANPYLETVRFLQSKNS